MSTYAEKVAAEVTKMADAARQVEDSIWAERAVAEDVEFNGDVSSVLDTAERYLRRFIVADDRSLRVEALWLMHTYSCYQASRETPYLRVWSPVPGCGKTQTVDTLNSIGHNGIIADGISAAALFRLIDKLSPTLFYDEIDSIFGGGKRRDTIAEDTRAILNAGYIRGRHVFRCADFGKNLQSYDVFGPKVLAGLDTLPPTLEDRSIPIRLMRALPAEMADLEDFDEEFIAGDAAIMRALFQKASDHMLPQLSDMDWKRENRPTVPGLMPRKNQIWKPLLYIAKLAGERWEATAIEAAANLSGNDAELEHAPNDKLELLQAIYDKFEGEEFVDRDTLLDRLNADPELTYGDSRAGVGISANMVSRNLSEFGIEASRSQTDGQRDRGYTRADLVPVVERYLGTA